MNINSGLKSSTFTFTLQCLLTVRDTEFFIMDCVTAAASLKKLLVAHSAAESQVSVLGKLYY